MLLFASLLPSYKNNHSTTFHLAWEKPPTPNWPNHNRNECLWCKWWQRSANILWKVRNWPHSIVLTNTNSQFMISPTNNCVTRAPLLYFGRSWVALSLVCESVSQWGIGNTCPNLHFLQYMKAWMSSTDPVSSITNCYRLIVSYTDQVHSFIIS